MTDDRHSAVQSLEQLDRDSLLHPFTRADDFAAGRVPGQRIVQSASGIRVTDARGRSVIDGMSGMYCVNVGYGRQAIVDAIAEQASELPYYHIFAGASHPKAIMLAEKLIALTGGRMQRVFFGLSGSDANETQIKLVWYYHNVIGKPQKKKIIARQRGYHGATTMTASLTGLPNYHSGFDLPFALVKHTLAPDAFWASETDPRAFSQRCANELERLILEEGPETVGAFIAEPVVGSGGILPPPPGYWEAIQAVLRKYDVLLIADEVICGFGRTGNMFGTETYGLKPDIITVAKALSSAYLPISATVISEDIYQACLQESDKIGVFAHGYTYSGHPVSAAVALETLKIYEERDILGHVRKVAPRFQEKLRSFASHPMVGEVRGVGLIGGIELVSDKATKVPFPASSGIGMKLSEHALKHGLIVRPLADTIGLCPPLIITEAEIDEMFARLSRSLEDTVAGMR